MLVVEGGSSEATHRFYGPLMQVLINGIVSGLALSLLALSFSVVYLPTRVFHLALGGIYSLAPLLLFSCRIAGLGWGSSIAITVIAGVAVSLAAEMINHYPLERRGASPAAHLISALGLYLLFIQVAVMIWGDQTRFFHMNLSHTVRLSGVIVTRSQIIEGVGSAVLITIFFVWIYLTERGIGLRALADNSTEYALRGHNVRAARLLVFGLAGFLCAAASLLVANDLGFSPHGALDVSLLAIVAMLIGGRASLFGSVLGGLILGVVRSMAAWYLSARWEDAAAFVIFVLFLFWCPDGLLANRGRLTGER